MGNNITQRLKYKESVVKFSYKYSKETNWQETSAFSNENNLDEKNKKNSPSKIKYFLKSIMKSE